MEHFNTEFLRVLDLHAPVKHVSFKHRTSPFITPKTKEQMKSRDKNLRKARKTRYDLDWALFRKSKTETVKMINEAEKLFVGNEIEQNKDNSRAIGKTIRRYLPNKSGGKLYSMSNAKSPVTRCNFARNLECNSTLGRCKIGKYKFPSQFANIFLTYQTFVTNLHLLRVELHCKLQEKLHSVTEP